MDVIELASLVERVADRWKDPNHKPRSDAVEATLKRNNRFTREAIAFAVNQQTHLLNAEALLQWVGADPVASTATVAVVNPGNIPFVELQDFLSVMLLGHRYRGKLSARSPYLLPAFIDELNREGAGVDAQLAIAEPDLTQSDALIASGTDSTIAELRPRAINAGIPPARMLLRGNRYSVAVIGPSESEETLNRLAEDILIHEGLGCRNVALVWAPEGLSPDPLLDAMARFRAVFPAHESTAGSLKLQIAFHRAADLPHAYADDESFLVSRGAPEVQQPGHVRWSEYDDASQVKRWLQDNEKGIQIIVASSSVASGLDLKPSSVVLPGNAQRPELGWSQDGVDVLQFLRCLSAA